MAVITITFICDFMKDKLKKDNVEKSKKKMKDKNKSKKGTEKAKNEILTEKIEKIEDENLTVTVNVKNPLKYLHMEYNLIPNNSVFTIDVVFWGTVAKVYTKDGMKAMKSINKNGHYWIAFSIKHVFQFNHDNLIKFKSHTVNFSLWSSKNKVGSSAKKDTVKTFYFDENDIESTFTEAFEVNPSIDNTETEADPKSQNLSDVKHILKDLMNFPADTEILNILNIIPDKLHCKKIIHIIENILQGRWVNCLNSEDNAINIKELLKEKKSKGKKSNKKSRRAKKGKKGGKNDGALKLSVPAELFFTDPNMSLFDFKTSNSDMSQAFILMHVEKLMSQDQINDLVPVVVKIEKVLNFPCDLLIENGYSMIYASYTIGDANYTTGARPISNEMRFKDHYMHFMNNCEPIILAEQIQTGYLIVQIHGIRSPSKDRSDAMFGKYEKDKAISKNLQNIRDVKRYTEGTLEENKKSILLAVACFKLDPLLQPFWRFSNTNYCIHPQNINFQIDKTNNLFDKITINSINIENTNNFDKNPLSDGYFLINGTSLKVEVQLLKPINKSLNSLKYQETLYNRIVLVVYKPELSKMILTNILKYNSYWLDSGEILPNYLNKTENINADYAFNSQNLLTGFVVECGDFCLMIVEGMQRWINHLLWIPIKDESTTALRVYYNSDYIFQERIYMDFIPYGGVYIITLQHSLSAMLKRYKFYTRGFVPEPCRRALRKIDLILKSKTLTDITIGIFPTAKELLSLDFEWGVPLHLYLDRKK